MVGVALATVLVTVATFTLAALLLLRTMSPLLEPAEAVPANRTYTVVLAIVPAEPTVTEELNVLLSVDTSYWEGGVTKKPSLRLDPKTENGVEDEGVP
jgi:hypothetical protein